MKIDFQKAGVGRRVRGALRNLFEGEGTQADADIAWAYLVESCYDDRSTYVPGEVDGGLGMAMREGRRQVLADIRKAIRWSEAESAGHAQSGHRAVSGGA